MIQDANDMEDGSALHADICIVGAGAAGITLALRLMDSGLSVLLLESGGAQIDPATQSLYQGAVADAALHAAPDRYRERRLGGTTGIWGGRCVPFDDLDFAERPWIAETGWPFARDTLLAYYAEANSLCEAGRFAYTTDLAFPSGARPIVSGFDGTHFTDTTLERFSCPTDFGRRYRARLAESTNLRVVLHANVTEIRTDAAGQASAVCIRTLGGKTMRATAQHFVLAMGGLEIPRLLLASRDRHAAGIGNGEDCVGRFYMCHIAGTIGTFHAHSAVYHGYEMSQEGIYCRRRFALTAETQRARGIGNFVAHLHHPRIPDASHRTGPLSALYLARSIIPYEYRKRLTGEGATGSWAAHVRNVVLDPFATAGFLLHWARKRTLAERKFPSIIVRPRSGIYSIDFNAEQEPNRDSRVTLTSERDCLGMPRIAIDWRHTSGDMRTVREALSALADDFNASDCGFLDYDPAEVELSALRDGAYGGHHIGTTRMAMSPRHGVVDADCRVHGVANLYVASSAVFPTSSQANPTLTIVAMALRLADHLLGVANRYQPGAGMPAAHALAGV